MAGLSSLPARHFDCLSESGNLCDLSSARLGRGDRVFVRGGHQRLDINVQCGVSAPRADPPAEPKYRKPRRERVVRAEPSSPVPASPSRMLALLGFGSTRATHYGQTQPHIKIGARRFRLSKTVMRRRKSAARVESGARRTFLLEGYFCGGCSALIGGCDGRGLPDARAPWLVTASCAAYAERWRRRLTDNRCACR